MGIRLPCRTCGNWQAGICLIKHKRMKANGSCRQHTKMNQLRLIQEKWRNSHD